MTFVFSPQDYWSTTVSKPTRDRNQNLVLIRATESNGFTTVEFERDPETNDAANDIQFKVN